MTILFIAHTQQAFWSSHLLPLVMRKDAISPPFFQNSSFCRFETLMMLGVSMLSFCCKFFSVFHQCMKYLEVDALMQKYLLPQPRSFLYMLCQGREHTPAWLTCPEPSRIQKSNNPGCYSHQPCLVILLSQFFCPYWNRNIPERCFQTLAPILSKELRALEPLVLPQLCRSQNKGSRARVTCPRLQNVISRGGAQGLELG